MLEDAGVDKKYADGEVVFKQGDTGNEMYIVRSGKVKIFRTKDGKETMLAHLKPDDFFGEMAFFGDQPRSASVVAVGETTLQVVDKRAFMHLIKAPVVWSIMEKMSDRIREIDDKVEDLSVQDQVRKEHLSTLTIRNSWFV